MANNDEHCSECGAKVTIQIMKGSGVCGENCRKVRDGEVDRPQAQTDAGITNLLKHPDGINLNSIK